MTIIPRALISHQLRCDVQDCHACGGNHVGLMFYGLPKPYGNYTRATICPGRLEFVHCNVMPVLMTESQAGPFAAGKDD